MDTESRAYADRLVALELVWWKRLLNVQAPYQWNLRRRNLGRTLEIGCGVGRNLATLPAGSVGVDHNAASVQVARARGFHALTVDEFFASDEPALASFDALLIAHVIEHLSPASGQALLRDYLPRLRPGGRVFFICPQERGYSSDPTHVRWTTGEDLQDLAREVGLVPERWTSFPLPRAAGKAFRYNEFNLVAQKPA
jgi:SAM-dependent methyltransferase